MRWSCRHPAELDGVYAPRGCASILGDVFSDAMPDDVLRRPHVFYKVTLPMSLSLEVSRAAADCGRIEMLK